MSSSLANELIRELLSNGLFVDYELARRIVDNGSEALSELMRIVDDKVFWEPRKELGDGWAPIHALHLLAAIGDSRCLPVVVKVLLQKAELLDDWLTESMPYILASFGVPAVSELKPIVADRRLDTFVRNVAARALRVIAYRHTEVREEVVKLFCEVFSRTKEDRDFLTLTAPDILQLRDPRLLQPVLQAVKRRLIDRRELTANEAYQITYSNVDELAEDLDLTNPMEHFKPENILYLAEVNYGRSGMVKEWAEKHGLKLKSRMEQTIFPLSLPEPVKSRDAASLATAQPRDVIKKPKVGRNEPCPCGSGIKYKKCCGNPVKLLESNRMSS